MKRKGKWFRDRDMPLSWLMLSFVIAVLINAVLITTSSYMLMLRFGIGKTWMSSWFWPFIPMSMCAVCAVLLTVSFGRSRIRPIHRVNAAMKKVSQGDFTVRVEDKNAVGEISDLVSSYNHMAEELSGIEMFRKDFINNFSHEFKTPIVSIRGFARQLERDDLTIEQRREYTHIIAAESERLANMSANILLLTKLENQRIITDREYYALDEQIRSCILLLEKQWTDKDIDLRLDLDEISYLGNEEMMSHIWVNLIGNAIKYSPEGGALEISLMRVQNFIEAKFTDHGEGMTAETQARVFEKFYQGDNAHAVEGNGLGLALVRRIVDMCGGKITVNSAPGEGSTFAVYLPVEKKKDEDRQNAKPARQKI